MSEEELTAYTYQVETEDEGMTVYEKIEYTLYVPFGSKISNKEMTADELVYIYSSANGQGELSELEKVDKYDNPYGDSRYYRLRYWSDMDKHLYSGQKVNGEKVDDDTTIFYYADYTDPIVGDLKLYPVFENAYHVNFVVGNSYADLFECEQFVVTNELIHIKQELISPVDYSERIKYIISAATMIMPEESPIPETYIFTSQLEISEQEVYIRIFFNLDMITYIPEYTETASGETAEAYDLKKITLNLNEMYYIRDLYEFYGGSTEGVEKFTTPDMADYGNATFADWYISNVDEYYSSDVAYLMGNYTTEDYSVYSLNLGEINRFVLRQNGAIINIIFYYTDGSMVTVEMDDHMAVYAKIYNTNDIAVARTAKNVAHFDIARVVDTDGNERGYINEDYFTLYTESAEKYSATGEEGYTRIQFTTVYNSAYTPVINLRTNDGYNLSKVSVYDNNDNYINNNYAIETVTPDFWTKTEGKHVDETSDNFTINIDRTTAYPGENDPSSSYTRISNKVQINKLKNINTNIFVLQVKYLSYDISFVHDNSKSYLQYRDASGNNQRFVSNSMNVNLGVTVHNEGANYTVMSLPYETSLNGTTHDNTITIKGVPYGTTLNVFTTMNGSGENNLDVNTNLDYWYHFANWGPTPTNIGFIDNEANTQKITPSDEAAGKTYISAYTINAVILPNVIEAINFNVMYTKTVDSAWSELWAAMMDPSASVSVNHNNGVYTMLAIHSDLDADNGFTESVVGGTDISGLISDVNDAYTTKYNSKIASTEGMGSVTQFGPEQLLNYFWFDEIWESLQDEETRKIYQLVDGKIYAKYGYSVIELYGRLEDAIIAYFGQEIIDYLDVEDLQAKYGNEYLSHLNEAAIINNINRAVISDLTVTNSYITAGNRGYFALTPDGVGGYSSIYGSDGKIKSNIVQMYIKAPSYSQIDVKYTPMAKTATNNTYHLNSFNTGDKDSNAFGYSLANSVASLNKQSYSVTELSNLFKRIGIAIPEIRLQAQFMIDTHRVTFFRSEGSEIGDAAINTGYDEDVYRACLADGRQELAERYYCSLENLRKVNRLPLFIIDPLAYAVQEEFPLFNHPSDDDVMDKTYGNYSHVFTKWLGVADIVKPITTNTALTADYATTSTAGPTLSEFYITYAINNAASLSADMVTLTYYLARENFLDCFGNGYTKDLSNLLLTNLNNTIANNETIGNIYYSTENTKFYEVTLDNTDNKYIANATYATQAQHGKYYSVPVTYQVSANRRDVAYISDNVTVTTIGGAVIVSTDSSNSNITFSGVLLVGGDVRTDYTYTIKPGSFDGYRFGLWELNVSYPFNGATFTTFVDYCSHVDCTACPDRVFAGVELSVNAHFNAGLRFSPDQLERGEFTVKNVSTGIISNAKDIADAYVFIAELDSTQSTGVRVGNEPTKEDAYHNVYYTIVAKGKTGTTGNGYNIYEAEIRQNYNGGTTGTVLYTLTYTANQTLKGLKWIVSYQTASATKAVPLQDSGDHYEFLDLRNIHSIVPLSIQTDIKFVFTDGTNDGREVYGVITNLENSGVEYLQHYYNTNRIFSVTNSLVNTKVLEGTRLEIKPENNGKKLMIYDGETNTGHYGFVTINPVVDTLVNFRLQYKTLQGTWVDFEEGSTFAQPSVKELNPDGISRNMYIRVACEWATYKVDFETVYRNASDNGNLDAYTSDYGSVFLNNKTELMGSRINVNGTNTDSMTLEVFVGSTIAYNEELKQFTIIAPKYGASNSIADKVIIGDYKKVGTETYNYTLTGWVKEVTNTGNVAVVEASYVNDLSIHDEDFPTLHLTYIAWVEKSQDFKVSVDTTAAGYTHGYGQVTINRKTAIDIFAGADGETVNYDYSKLILTEGNTGYYAYYRSVGKTNQFVVTIEQSDNMHELINASYESINSQGTYDTVVRWATPSAQVLELTESAYTFGTEMKVIFNAEPTLSNIAVYNNNLSLVQDMNGNAMKYVLYGGYQYKVTQKQKDSIYTLSITDYWNKTVSYDYKLRENTVFRRFYLSEYDTEEERDEKNARGNYLIDTVMEMTNTTAGKFVAFQINEKVVKITFTIVVNYLDKFKNNKSGINEYSGWSNMLEIKSSKNESHTRPKLTVSVNPYDLDETKQAINLSVFANKGAGLGGVLFNYIDPNPDSKEYDYIFRPINEFMLETVAISPPKGSVKDKRTISTDYNNQTSTVETVAGHESKLLKDVEITYTEYIILFSLTQRPTVNVSFGLSLPHATDYRNLQISTNVIPAAKKVQIAGAPHFTVNGHRLVASDVADMGVYNTALSNSKDTEGDVYMPSNFKVEPTSTVHLSSQPNAAGTLYTLYIDVEGNSSSRIIVLQFVDDGTYSFKGVYMVQSSSAKYVTKDSVKLSGATAGAGLYSMWGAGEDKGGIIKTSDASLEIMGDARIMLYFERKATTVKVSENIWTNNYNKTPSGQYYYESLNTNLVFLNNTSVTHTYTFPSGLVGVVPTYYHPIASGDKTTEIFYQNTQYSYEDMNTDFQRRMAPIYANNLVNGEKLEDTWKKNGNNAVLRLTYGDSDLYTRIVDLINHPTWDSAVTNAREIISAKTYDAYKIVGKNMAYGSSTTATAINFNVELKGSTEWLLMNLPYGNTDVDIAHYVKVKFFTDNQGTSFFPVEGADANGYTDTLSSSPFTLRSTTFLTADNTGTYSYKMQVAKLRTNRLTNGMYVGPNAESLDYYGRSGKKGLNLQYEWTTGNAAKSPEDWRAYIKGYKVVYYDNNNKTCSRTYTEKSYFDPKDIDNKSTKTLNFNSLTGLSELSGYIVKVDIYPIWEEVRVYEVKFNINSMIYGEGSPTEVKSSSLVNFTSFNAEVIAGDPYEFKFNNAGQGFGAYTIAKTSNTTKNDYHVKSLYTIGKDYGTTFVLLKNFKLTSPVDGSNVRNMFSYSSNAGTAIAATNTGFARADSNGIYFKLSSVKADITITPEWIKRGRTFNYEHNGTITISDALKKNAKDEKGNAIAIKQASKTVATLAKESKTWSFAFAPNYLRKFNALGETITGRKHSQKAYEYISSTHPDEFFSIVKDGNILKNVGDNTVSFTLVHDKHALMVDNQGAGKCFETTKTTCRYCTYYTYSEEWHHIDDSDWSNDTFTSLGDSQHRHVYYCDADKKDCYAKQINNRDLQIVKTRDQGHEFTQTKAPGCTSAGSKKCNHCGKTASISAVGHSKTWTTGSNGSYWAYAKALWAEKPISVRKFYQGFYGDKYFSNYSEFSTVGYGLPTMQVDVKYKAATCTSKATYVCSRCFVRQYEGEKLNHNFSTLVYRNPFTNSKSPSTCGQYGYKCTTCNNINSSKNTSKANGDGTWVVPAVVTVVIVDNSYLLWYMQTLHHIDINGNLQDQWGEGWTIQLKRPDPKHCYTWASFDRFVCKWCDTFLYDEFKGTENGHEHSKDLTWTGYYCGHCGLDINYNGFDEVSNEVLDWSEVRNIGHMNGWVGYGPWLFAYRAAYTTKMSEGGATPSPGLTWGLWYAVNRGDEWMENYKWTITLSTNGNYTVTWEYR